MVFLRPHVKVESRQFFFFFFLEIVISITNLRLKVIFPPLSISDGKKSNEEIEVNTYESNSGPPAQKTVH